jgi:hypothetical protein
MSLDLIISYLTVDCQYISITVQYHLILLNAQNPACKSHNRLVTIKETTPNSGPFPFLHPAAGGGATTGPGVGPSLETARGDRRGKCKDGSPGRVADERIAGPLSACGGIVVRSYAPSTRPPGHPAPTERATTIHGGEGRGARSKVTSWPRSEVNGGAGRSGCPPGGKTNMASQSET